MGILANFSGVTYFPIRSRYFWGKMPTRPTTLNEWIKAARQEHESEYMDYIGVKIGLKRIVLDPRKVLFGRDPDDEPEGVQQALPVESAE
jgi:hypothetical protein